MISPDDHPQEKRRLEVLRRFGILDTDAEQRFDDLVLLASTICEVPIALVSLVDEARQWFKASVGLAAKQTPRDISFCGHAILSDEVLVVKDARVDPRFHDNPLVTQAPEIRFYAGAPIHGVTGLNMGTLCVIDRKPRELSDAQLDALQALSRQAASQLTLRLQQRELAEALRTIKVLSGVLSMCAGCKLMRDDERWIPVEQYLFEHAEAEVSHGLCPDCVDRLHPVSSEP